MMRVGRLSKSRLGKDTLTTLVSQVLVMLLALLVNKWLSVNLGVEGYGQYSIIKKSTQVLSFVMLGGMGIALPRFYAIYRAKGSADKGRATVLASAALVAMISLPVLVVGLLLPMKLAPLVTGLMTGSDNASLYQSALLYAFSITVATWWYAYYRGAGAFMKFAVAQVLVQGLTALIAWWYGSDLSLMLRLWSYGTLLVVAAALALDARTKESLHLTNHPFKAQLKTQLKTLAKYGLPRLLGDFFLFSFAAFPLVYLNQHLDIRASSYFSVGLTLLGMLTPAFSMLGMVLLPWVSSALVGNRFQQAEKLIGRLMWAFPALAAVAALTVGWGMDFFIRLFFDPAFLPAISISRILLISLVFESLYLLLRNPIDAVSTRPYNTLNMLLSLLVLVGLFAVGTTLTDYAYAFLAATVLKATLSVFTWQKCRKNWKL